MYHDGAEKRQRRNETLPDPPRYVFAGGIFESLNVIQIVMIELVENWLEGRFQVPEVHYPSAISPYRSGNVYFDAKRMSMQARAFMLRRHIREKVRGLKCEGFVYFHDKSG